MIVIDFEVFKHDWLCVAVDLANKQETVIVNDRDALVELHTNTKLFIGYNIRNYDAHIMKAILCDINPYEVSQQIIVNGIKGHQFSKMMNQVNLTFFDIMPNPPVGLKTLEGFMGSDIQESSVPFDIDRKLTTAEINDVIKYCRHDVMQTIEVFIRRQEEFTSQLELVKMFNMPAIDMGRTKAQLSAKALGARYVKHNDETDFTIPANLRIKKYQFVVDWFKQCRNAAVSIQEFYKQKLECDIAGVPHVFAWGGIHGARQNYCETGYFVNVDVALA